MQENKQLSGEIKQLTIFGQLRFIYGKTYKITKMSDKKCVMVSGIFEIVGTENKVDTTIEIEKTEFLKHKK